MNLTDVRPGMYVIANESCALWNDIEFSSPEHVAVSSLDKWHSHISRSSFLILAMIPHIKFENFALLVLTKTGGIHWTWAQEMFVVAHATQVL